MDAIGVRAAISISARISFAPSGLPVILLDELGDTGRSR